MLLSTVDRKEKSCGTTSYYDHFFGHGAKEYKNRREIAFFAAPKSFCHEQDGAPHSDHDRAAI